MRKKEVHQRRSGNWKTCTSFFIILFLLPYVLSTFIHGADLQVIGKANVTYVKVQKEEVTGETNIVSLPWEDYLVGILAKEMPPIYEEETLKAQVILIRTRLYQELEESAEPIFTESYWTYSEMEKQWMGEDSEEWIARLQKAVEDTENFVLRYQDGYALAPFHQSSNGKTRNATEVLGMTEYPYLQTKECEKDKEAEDEMQVTNLEYSHIQTKCQPFLQAVAPEESGKTLTLEDFEILSYDTAGYVSQIRVGDTILSGDQFRDALSLASSSFSIKESKGKLCITTLGKGHGLGLSQWSANEMAKEGKSYQEILQYFFEGTDIEDGGEIFSKIE